MNPILKNSIIGGVILLALFFAYRAFFAGEDEAALSSTTPTDVPAEQGDLLSLLLELKSITLSEDIFSDPAFATLQDFTVTLAPEPIGRSNPFDAIGASGRAEEADEDTATSS